jgi:hypothetical protein
LPCLSLPESKEARTGEESKGDLCLRHYDFVLVSDFDIRISYFGGRDSSMIAVRPRRNAKDPGWILPMTQETNHAQEKPRQIRFVCPNLRYFLGGNKSLKGSAIAEQALKKAEGRVVSTFQGLDSVCATPFLPASASGIPYEERVGTVCRISRGTERIGKHSESGSSVNRPAKRIGILLRALPAPPLPKSLPRARTGGELKGDFCLDD